MCRWRKRGSCGHGGWETAPTAWHVGTHEYSTSRTRSRGTDSEYQTKPQEEKRNTFRQGSISVPRKQANSRYQSGMIRCRKHPISGNKSQHSKKLENRSICKRQSLTMRCTWLNCAPSKIFRSTSRYYRTSSMEVC